MAKRISSDHWNRGKISYPYNKWVSVLTVPLSLHNGWAIKAPRRITLDPERELYAEDGRATLLTLDRSPLDHHMTIIYHLTSFWHWFSLTFNYYNTIYIYISSMNTTNEWHLLSSDYGPESISYGFQLSPQFPDVKHPG